MNSLGTTYARCLGWFCRMLGSITTPSWRTSATGASTQQMKKSLLRSQTAHVDHFVNTLPEGYHMVLNEETSNLSQGQMQLLTIARAVLSRPKDPHPRRSHKFRRHSHRNLNPAGYGSSDEKSHKLCHCASLVHYSQCGFNISHARWRHCRTRESR